MTTFSTRVCNIPCQCKVDYTAPYPTERENFEFELLDRKGYKAAWLERKLTYQIEDELYEQFVEHVQSGYFIQLA